MTSNFYFLNHTSLVIQNDNDFLLLDPWLSGSLSFDGWEAHPPSFLNEDVLLAFINSKKSNIGVVISHGHDDHCDDEFLKKINNETQVFFPNYISKGALRRITQNGLNNITELSVLKQYVFGSFTLSSYIFEDYSLDDAVITIKTDEYFLIHANDNSIPFSQEFIEYVISDSKGLKVYLASQTGIANGFPYCYPQFFNNDNVEESMNFAKQKITTSVQIAIDNAKKLRANFFISYAAYTLSMPLLKKFNGVFSQFLPTPKNLKNLDLNWGNIDLLDFKPGDTLNPKDLNITHPFWTESVDFEDICDEIKALRLKELNKFDKNIQDKAGIFIKNFTVKNLEKYISNYLENFVIYLNKSNNKFKLSGCIIELAIENRFTISLNLNDDKVSINESIKVNKRITISETVSWLLVSGIWNFESLYIGHHGVFHRFPETKYNEILMNQLQIFGYVYQKRMVPDELKL
tara:strand:- start:24 stop:1406 length:1383 start_codon:yes stop_codon:yes gene_type:complete